MASFFEPASVDDQSFDPMAIFTACIESGASSLLPDVSVHSSRFQDFAREANKGNQYRFFADRQSAIEWLEAKA